MILMKYAFVLGVVMKKKNYNLLLRSVLFNLLYDEFCFDPNVTCFISNGTLNLDSDGLCVRVLTGF